MAHSEYILDDLKDRVDETENVWSFGLHCRVSSDIPAFGFSVSDRHVEYVGHLVSSQGISFTGAKWRFTLHFVQLNHATGGLEGWPIPNIY